MEATYATVNFGDASCPDDIAGRSICIDADIGRVLKDIKKAE